jgi:hypothetical protein
MRKSNKTNPIEQQSGADEFLLDGTSALDFFQKTNTAAFRPSAIFRSFV